MVSKKSGGGSCGRSWRSAQVAAGLVAVCGLALLAWPAVGLADSDSFMSPMGHIAAEQKSHFIWVTLLTMVAVAPVLILLPLILLRYRRRRADGQGAPGKGGAFRPNWEFSLPLEITMWGLPILLIIVMSVGLWNSTHQLDPYRPIEAVGEAEGDVGPPVRVQVVGLDWKWLFIYPDLGIASVGEMAVPVGRPVAMTLTTDTVMQSFIISALAGQIYAMPGMTTELHVMADQPGNFQGENMQYNGNGFVDQKFVTKALPSADFESWVAKVSADGVALDERAYNTLAVQGSRAQAHQALASDAMPADAIYFTLPDAMLFSKIVGRYHSGAPLALDEQPGTPAFAASVEGAVDGAGEASEAEEGVQ
ncbi:MAG: cytochrome ubiquinol oxidase subunit II [Pseudomonadota bacterium]